MKKLFCLLLALLLCMSAVAEMADSSENVTPANAAFVLRNGITWGASPEAVQAAEGAVDDLYEGTPWMQLYYYSVSVSNYKADLSYIFREEQLVCIGYDFFALAERNRLPEEDYLYMTEALSSKYGESLGTADTQRVRELMNTLSPIEDEWIISLYGAWELEDGTYIAALSMENLFYILYFDEPTMYQLCGIYNTSGL